MFYETHIFPEPDLHGHAEHIRYIECENGCHESIAHRQDRDGYPKLERNGKEWVMSRYIMTLTLGEIPKGMVVRHKCDNPECINPAHLELGTQADNMRDKKRRNKKFKHLTDEEVALIRSAANTSLKELSERFGVSGSTIYRILKEVTHKKRKRKMAA